MFIFYFYKCWKIKYGLTSYLQKLSKRSSNIFNVHTLPLFFKQRGIVLFLMHVCQTAHICKKEGWIFALSFCNKCLSSTWKGFYSINKRLQVVLLFTIRTLIVHFLIKDNQSTLCNQITSFQSHTCNILFNKQHFPLITVYDKNEPIKFPNGNYLWQPCYLQKMVC